MDYQGRLLKKGHVREQDIEIYGRRQLEETTGAKALRSGQIWCVCGTERRPVERVVGGSIGEITQSRIR